MGRILLYTSTGDENSEKVKDALLKKCNVSADIILEINITEYPKRKKEMKRLSGKTSIPQIFFNDKFIGGFTELQSLITSNKIEELLTKLASEPPTSNPTPPTEKEKCLKKNKKNAGSTPKISKKKKKIVKHTSHIKPKSKNSIDESGDDSPAHGRGNSKRLFPEITLEELDILFDRMRSSEFGIRRRDIGAFNRIKNCFKAFEAVMWLMSRLSVDEDFAIEIGQRLVDYNYIHPIKPLKSASKNTDKDKDFALSASCTPPHSSGAHNLLNAFPEDLDEHHPQPDHSYIFRNSGEIYKFYCDDDDCLMVVNMKRLFSPSLKRKTNLFFYPQSTPAPLSGSPNYNLKSLPQLFPIHTTGSDYLGYFCGVLTSLYDKYLNISETSKLINYSDLQSSHEFQNYVNFTLTFQKLDLKIFTIDFQLKSFFINLYNGLAIHAIVSVGPPANAADRAAFFDELSYLVGGMKFSLYDIKHGILRANRKPPGVAVRRFSKSDPRLEFSVKTGKFDPRIHFALCCGTKSCPVIKVYHWNTLESELTDSAEKYITETTSVMAVNSSGQNGNSGESGDGDYDPNFIPGVNDLSDLKQILIARTFGWFHDDFGDTDVDLLQWILPFLKNKTLSLVDDAMKAKSEVRCGQWDFELNNWGSSKKKSFEDIRSRNNSDSNGSSAEKILDKNLENENNNSDQIISYSENFRRETGKEFLGSSSTGGLLGGGSGTVFGLRDSKINVYRELFFKRQHDTWCGNDDDEGHFVISVLREKKKKSKEHHDNYHNDHLEKNSNGFSEEDPPKKYKILVRTKKSEFYLVVAAVSQKEVFESLKLIFPFCDKKNLVMIDKSCIPTTNNTNILNSSPGNNAVINSTTYNAIISSGGTNNTVITASGNNLTVVGVANNNNNNNNGNGIVDGKNHHCENSSSGFSKDFESDLNDRNRSDSLEPGSGTDHSHPMSLIEEDLLEYEEKMASTEFKFGVLHYLDQQTDEDQMFSNNNISPGFDKFLKLLGDRVKLKGYKGYAGGLDTEKNLTGVESVCTQWQKCEVMFHVSGLLPYSEKDPQQIQRKRHLGNDAVIILFHEGDTPFDPHCIASKYNQIYVVIHELKNKEKDGEPMYKVNVTSRVDVPEYLPRLPDPPIFVWGEEFREFLLTKIINGTKASLKAPSFASKIERSRAIALEEYVKKYVQK